MTKGAKGKAKKSSDTLDGSRNKFKIKKESSHRDVLNTFQKKKEPPTVIGLQPILKKQHYNNKPGQGGGGTGSRKGSGLQIYKNEHSSMSRDHYGIYDGQNRQQQ